MSATRPSSVRIERLGKASGGTNSGLSGMPGIGCEAYRYWLVAILKLTSFNAKTLLALVSALVSHSQFSAKWRSSLTVMSPLILLA
jgi:hypothetical protein